MSTSERAAESRADEASAAIERQLLRSTLANYVGKFVTLAIGLALTPFMLHQLGATDYALRVLVTSFVAYGTLLDLGVGAALTKYVAELRARGESLEVSRVHRHRPAAVHGSRASSHSRRAFRSHWFSRI